MGEGDKHVELQPMWENPKKVREVIQDDQVVGQKKSIDHNERDQRPEQPWTWKWKKLDESDIRADTHDRGAQRRPDLQEIFERLES